MWNLAVLLPLMVGDMVPDDDCNWECFLFLLEITKQCTARVTSSATAHYVAVLIEEHPDVSLPPKMHYMVHFPRLLK